MKTFLSLNLLTLSLSGGLMAADFFPLASGNQWIYREATTGQTFEMRVSTPTFTGDKLYYSLRGYTPEQLLVRVNENDNLVYWDQENDVEPVLAGFRPSGIPYSTNARQCPAWATTREDRVQHDGPAGRWSALLVDFQTYACADAGDLSEQYVENIGMVRRVIHSIAGPRTYDLVYARVGKLTITAGDTGQFTISALPGIDAASWDVTLRVAPMWAGSPTVTFPSSQEFEVRLRDSSGAVLWTWSADKLFLQALHTRSISGWTAALNVPHPIRVPEGIQSYTLEAWLTTAEGEPRFAAATVVTPGGHVELPTTNSQKSASRTRR